MRQDERKARQELLAHMAATIASGLYAGNKYDLNSGAQVVADFSITVARAIMQRANPPEKE